MGNNPELVPIIMLVIIIGGAIWLWNEMRIVGKNYTLVAEGKFEKVVYHSPAVYLNRTTDIYFEDGKAITGNGHYDMLFSRGTKIKVFKNTSGQLKIEVVL